MTRLRIDPAQYAAASAVFGQQVSGVVEHTLSGLKASLAGTSRMAGGDPAGAAWAAEYDRAADEAAQALSEAGRASVMLAALLEQCGFNHARAEAHSDVSGRVAVPPDTTRYAPGAAVCVSVPSAAGGGMDAPAGWEWIQQLCGAVWPDGDTGRLRQAGRAWDAAGSGLGPADGMVSGAVSAIRSQDSPEVGQAATVCAGFGSGVSQSASQCRAIGAACAQLADRID